MSRKSAAISYFLEHVPVMVSLYHDVKSMVTNVIIVQSVDLENSDGMSLFRPPVQRSATTVLDRSLFSKTIPISAARVADRKLISKCRQQLEKSKDLLRLERSSVVRPDPDFALAASGGKCLLLRPDIKSDG